MFDFGLYRWVVNHLVHFGLVVKGTLINIWAIPKKVKEAVFFVANLWIGIFVIGIIYVLWRKYKK